MGTVAELFEARCRQDLREQAAAESGATSWLVNIEAAADGGATVRVERSLPPDVPDAYKKFVGRSIEIAQVERWAPAAPDGSRSATIDLHIKGQPASMIGTIELVPVANGGATERIEGELRVAVPFIGRKVEPEVAKVVASALKIEQRLNDEWVAARR
ncbi:MAG: hypothetical protein JWN95_2779 [Frankiales bacterium]|nr:hypothetical protein [Frankiales bacterium]